MSIYQAIHLCIGTLSLVVAYLSYRQKDKDRDNE